MNTAINPPPPPAPSVPPGSLVAGIDTHKDTHHVAILDHLGRPVLDRQFAATPDGYRKIVDFLRSAGTVERVGIEGTGSYGTGITRVLSAEGFHVAEVARPNRRSRRLRGKSDPLDARQAALNVLSDSDTAVPKSAGGTVEVLRMLLAERRSASKAHAQVMNQIHALLVTAPDTVRGDYRHLGSIVLVGVLAPSRPRAGNGPEYAARQVLKRLAVRHVALTAEIGVIEQEMTRLLLAANPALFSLSGVGPVTAATLMVAVGDNPERLSSRSSFAALTGVAPIPASSGQRSRFRLSRGGNRQANSALHRIVLLRMRHREPRTVAYFARRRAEGLSDRDIMRCLKRHIANEVYRALMEPGLENPVGRQLHELRIEAEVPLSVLANNLEVPRQRLQRLEAGIRADTELEARATALLTQMRPEMAA